MSQQCDYREEKMSIYDKMGFELVGYHQRLAYVRKGNSRRAFVFISGFNQPAESWEDTIKVINRSHTIVIIVRRQENERASHFLGWQSIATQQREVVETILQLKCHELIGLRLTIVGHSVGSMIARHCLSHLKISGCTDRLVQIAPVPLTWHDFAFHLTFWMKGGLLAVPYVFLALLGISRGLSPPRSAVQGLFSGEINSDRFDDYFWSLVPDSALVFLQLTFWYNGTKEWEEVRSHWRGQNMVIGAPTDTTISSRSIMRLIQTAASPMTRLYWFSHGTPHCYWLDRGVKLDNNLARLREIIED